MLPEFLDRDEAATLEKAKRMEPVIACDGPQAPHARDLGDYSFPASAAVGGAAGSEGDAGLAGALRRRPRRRQGDTGLGIAG